MFSYKGKISTNRTGVSKFIFSIIGCLQENILYSSVLTGACPCTSTCVLSVYSGWKFCQAFYWLSSKELKNQQCD